MAAWQPEFRSGSDLSFAPDLAVALHVVDSSGRFSDTPRAFFKASDSRTNIDFYSLLGGARKSAIASGVAASAFGGMDYWSDTAFAEVGTGSALGARSSKVELGGLIEAKVADWLAIMLGGNQSSSLTAVLSSMTIASSHSNHEFHLGAVGFQNVPEIFLN